MAWVPQVHVPPPQRSRKVKRWKADWLTGYSVLFENDVGGDMAEEPSLTNIIYDLCRLSATRSPNSVDLRTLGGKLRPSARKI